MCARATKLRRMVRRPPTFLVLAAVCGGFSLAVACADDGDDPGVVPVVGSDAEAGGAPVDAPIVNIEASPAEPDAEPPAGDTCGDRAGLQANAPWPVGGACPTRSGVSSLTGPRSATASLVAELAGGESAPVIGTDGLVWLASKDGVMWAISGNGAPPRARKVGSGEITSTAAIAANGNVILGTPEGTLYAFNAGTPSDPDAGGGIVGGVAVLPIAWSLSLGAPIKSSPVIGPDSTIYVGTTDGKLVAAKQTPSIVWRADTGDTFGSSPALSRDGTIYVGSTDHKLHAITATDGSPRWATDVGAEIRSSPAVGGDGTVYIGTTDGKLHALTPAGAIKWTYVAGAPIVGTPAVYAGGVYVACEDKRLHAVNVVDGSSRWTFATLGIPRTPLITESGYLYFGSTDGRAYVLTPKGGLFFAVVAKGLVSSAPAISAQNFAYWSTDKGLSVMGR